MTDLELQHALAKMLPEKIDYLHNFAAKGTEIYWLETLQRIQDTEWLHVCWLIEQGLSDYCGENGEHDSQREQFALALLRQVATWPDNFHWGSQCDADFYKVANASWQQRARALIATLGEKKGEK